MTKPVGGRGKKAPYETTHARIPVAIKERVEQLSEEYRLSLLGEETEIETNSLTSLEDTEVKPSIKVLTSLSEAIELASKLLKQKKSSKQTIAKLLTTIYGEEVSVEDLE